MGTWPSGPELDLAFPTYVQRLRRDPSVGPWLGRAIVVRALGVVAGSINLKGPPAAGRVEIGYGLERPHRGHGYAREAARAVVIWALAHRTVREVVAVIDPTNGASERVAISLGMAATGERSIEHPGSRVWTVTRRTLAPG
jgi:RimJ/RimL family protein N-acetyltransferase